MGEQVIVLTELTKQYGKFTAVDHIRLSIRKGEILVCWVRTVRKVNYYFDDDGINGAHIGNCRDLWN